MTFGQAFFLGRDRQEFVENKLQFLFSEAIKPSDSGDAPEEKEKSGRPKPSSPDHRKTRVFTLRRSFFQLFQAQEVGSGSSGSESSGDENDRSGELPRIEEDLDVTNLGGYGSSGSDK